MYSSSLDNYSRSSTIDVSSEWDGSRSQRFKKGKRIFPAKDLIQDCVNMPNQTIDLGRHHFANDHSPQYEFRRPKKKIQWSEYWHPRASQIKKFDFKPSSPHPRAQMRHVRDIHNNPQSRLQSIRTEFLSKQIPTHQYHVEDRMQRKVRLDPLELRKYHYQNLNIFKRPLIG